MVVTQHNHLICLNHWICLTLCWVQAKILYNVPFSEDEKQNIKIVIQRNVYRYIGILLEGREHFKEDHLMEVRRQRADEPGPSGTPIVISSVAIFKLFDIKLCAQTLQDKHWEMLQKKFSPFFESKYIFSYMWWIDFEKLFWFTINHWTWSSNGCVCCTFLPLNPPNTYYNQQLASVDLCSGFLRSSFLWRYNKNDIVCFLIKYQGHFTFRFASMFIWRLPGILLFFSFCNKNKKKILFLHWFVRSKCGPFS